MESLNGHSAQELKEAISKQTKYDIKNIRFFGSRITGGWKEDSDLDIAILDENKTDHPIFYTSCLGINCECRFVDTFDQSWLKKYL